MKLFDLILIAIGLSMDAFSVSICKGLCMTKFNKKSAFLIALFFGGFQAIMPLIGWFVGLKFSKTINAYDHWIAFVLLGIIGGKMIYEAIFGKEDEKLEYQLKISELFILAIATSIDALAIGITFSLIGNVNITEAVSLIGIITFVFSYTGVMIGHFFGAKFQKKAEIVGGIVLVGIGIKILLEHLDIINI